MKLTDCRLVIGIILAMAGALHISGLHADPKYGDTKDQFVESSPAILEIDRHAGFEIHLDPALGSTALWQAVAGDINGDGIDDLIIGLPLASPQGREQAGLVAVIFGSDQRFDARINLSELDGKRGFMVEGRQPGDRLGWSVDVLADFNGNGHNDLAIGAPGRSHDSGSGAVYLLFGADQFPARIDPDLFEDGAGLRLKGDDQAVSFGFAVAALGDFNGNGLSDLAVGDPDAAAGGQPGAGAVHIVHGGSGIWPSVMQLDDDAGGSLRINGAGAYHFLGSALAGTGDFMANGYDDLLIGAPGADSAYLVFGGIPALAGGVSIDDLTTTDAIALVSAHAPEQFGVSVGRFEDRLFIGAPMAGDSQFEAPGAVYLIDHQTVMAPGVVQVNDDSPYPPIRLTGTEAELRLGLSASVLGDLGGDGRPKLVVAGMPPADADLPLSATTMLLMLASAVVPADQAQTESPTTDATPAAVEPQDLRFDGRGLSGPRGTRNWAIAGLGALDGSKRQFVIFGERRLATGHAESAHSLFAFPAGIAANGPIINDGDGIANQTMGTDGATLSIPFTVSEEGVAEPEFDNYGYNATETAIVDEGYVLDFSFTGSGSSRTLIIDSLTVGAGLAEVAVIVTNPETGAATTERFVLGMQQVDAPFVSTMPDRKTYNNRSVNNDFSWDETVGFNDIQAHSSDEGVVDDTVVDVFTDATNGTGMVSVTGDTAFVTSGETFIYVVVDNTNGNIARGFSGFLLEVFPPTNPWINDGEGIAGPFEVGAGQSLVIPFTIGDLVDPPEALDVSAIVIEPAAFPEGQLIVGCDAVNPEQCELEVTTNEFDDNLSPVTLQVSVCYPDCGDTVERSAFTEFDVIIEQAPQPPVINNSDPIPDQVIFEGQADSVQFTVTEPVPCDPGAGPLVVDVFSQDPGLIADADLDLVDLGGDLHELTIQTTLDALGLAGITVTASNCAGAVDSTFSVEILERPGPEFNAGAGIPDQVVVAGEMLEVPFSVSDTLDAPEDIDVAAISNNPEALPDTSITLDSPCAGGECLLVIQAPETSASVTVSVIATNSANRATTEDFALVIEQAPVPPVINNNFPIPDQAIFEGQSDSVGFTVSEPIPCDPADEQLSVMAISGSPQLIAQGNLNLVDFGDGSFELTIQTALGETGTAVITISASNCAGTTDSSFNVEILPRPGPQINDGAGIFDRSVLAGESITIEFIVSDQFDPPAAINVVGSSGTPALVDNDALTIGGVGNQRTLTIETEAGLPGQATIFVTATNSAGRSTTTSFVLTIVEREPPLINDGEALEDRQMMVGETIEVEFSIADVIDPADALAVSTHSSIQAVLADAAIVIEGTGNERTLVLDGSDATVGITRITIVVENTAGITSTLAFDLIVVDPPTTLLIEMAKLESGPSPDIYYRVDIENSGNHDAHNVVLDAVLDGDYAFVGAYSLAEDCDDTDGVVTCDADSIIPWSCESTDDEVHCSLLLLPTGTLAAAVIHLLGNGAGLLETSSQARNSAKVSDSVPLGD